MTMAKHYSPTLQMTFDAFITLAQQYERLTRGEKIEAAALAWDGISRDEESRANAAALAAKLVEYGVIIPKENAA